MRSPLKKKWIYVRISKKLVEALSFPAFPQIEHWLYDIQKQKGEGSDHFVNSCHVIQVCYACFRPFK